MKALNLARAGVVDRLSIRVKVHAGNPNKIVKPNKEGFVRSVISILVESHRTGLARGSREGRNDFDDLI